MNDIKELMKSIYKDGENMRDNRDKIIEYYKSLRAYNAWYPLHPMCDEMDIKLDTTEDDIDGYIELNTRLKDRFGNPQVTIYTGINTPQVRRNFTIAHELAHWVNDYECLYQKAKDDTLFGIGRMDSEMGLSKLDKEKRRVIIKQERIANEYGANIIMPEFEFVELFIQNKHLLKHATTFGASIPAVQTRGRNLRLVNFIID